MSKELVGYLQPVPNFIPQNMVSKQSILSDFPCP